MGRKAPGQVLKAACPGWACWGPREKPDWWDGPVRGEGPLDCRVGKRGAREGFLEVVRAELQVRDSRGCGVSTSRRERAHASCPGEISMAIRYLGVPGKLGVSL